MHAVNPQDLLKRLVDRRPSVPSEIDGSLSCFWCDAPLRPLTDEGPHAPDCPYVETWAVLRAIATVVPL